MGARRFPSPRGQRSRKLQTPDHLLDSPWLVIGCVGKASPSESDIRRRTPNHPSQRHKWNK